jgi:diguanylate cyclase (GGDEF)-like protein
MTQPMGLRLKIVTILVLVLGLFAVANVLIYEQQAIRAAEAQERSEATHSLLRLLQAMDSQLSQLDAVLGGWSNWTSLYEHAARPSKTFLRDEWTENGLTQTNIDWIFRFDNKNRPTDILEKPIADGSRVLGKLINERPEIIQPVIDKLLATPGQEGCGVTRVEDRLSLFCFRPVLTSDGVGPAHGVVVIGRRISAKMKDEISTQTGLRFDIALDSPVTKDESEVDPIRARIGEGVPHLHLAEQTMRIDFPITGFIGNAASAIQLTLERSTMLRAKLSAQKTVVSTTFLIILAGALLIWVIDSFIVQRITRMRTALGEIVSLRTWEGEIPRQGNDEIDELATHINEVIVVVREQMLDLRHASLTDPLTQLANRRRFDERFKDALNSHERSGRPLALILLDADDFKKYNDVYGHPAGDAVLQGIAQCLRDNARRPADLHARMGGEEFAVLLDDTDMAGATRCAEAILQSLVNAGFVHKGNSAAQVMSLSAGVAVRQAGDNTETLYHRADQALYQAKMTGKNRVCVAEGNTDVTKPV